MRQFALLADCLQKGLHKLAVQSVRRFPCGLWITGDGREVMIDAGYKPIWQRLLDGGVEPANPDAWVEDIVRREHFFDDWPPLHLQYDNLKRLRAVMLAWRASTAHAERRSEWQARVQRYRRWRAEQR
jgi:hypothetical protein